MANLYMTKVSPICLHPSRPYTTRGSSSLFLEQLLHSKMRRRPIDTSTLFLTIVVLSAVSMRERTIRSETAERDFYRAFNIPVRM